MTFGMAFKHWWNKSYPTVDEMFKDQFGQYCIDTGNCRSCYAALKDKTGAYGNVECVKVRNIDYARKIVGNVLQGFPEGSREVEIQGVGER